MVGRREGLTCISARDSSGRDGAPFSVDDILFWWEDIEQRHQYSPLLRTLSGVVNGEPMQLEKVDDVTSN
jgi:hypothetical protein